MSRNRIKSKTLDRAWEMISRGVSIAEASERLGVSQDELEEQLESRLERLDARDTDRERARRREKHDA